MSDRFGSRWAALWVMATAFPWRTGFLVLLCVATGVVPGLFALAVGGIVGAVPGAARDGLGSTEGRMLLTALLVVAGVLLLGELLGLVLGFHTDALYRRLDEAVLARVMRACLAPAGVGHLEDPEQQRRAAPAPRAARFGPGEFVSGVSAKLQARAGGLVATILGARINLLAALGLFVIWLLIGFQVTAAHYRGEPFLVRSTSSKDCRRTSTRSCRAGPSSGEPLVALPRHRTGSSTASTFLLCPSATRRTVPMPWPTSP